MIEVNPRASRTVPFVSKATGIPWAKVAAKLMIDSGFTQVVNLRRGIVEWTREGLPVTR